MNLSSCLINSTFQLRQSVCFQNKGFPVIPRGGKNSVKCLRNMASQRQESREELDEKARDGETVVPGGTGGKSLEAQEHLAEGRSRGGQRRKEQLGREGYQEMGSKGGQTRKEQIGSEGYHEMGKKGGLSTMDMSGEERAQQEGIDIDESKYKTRSSA